MNLLLTFNSKFKSFITITLVAFLALYYLCWKWNCWRMPGLSSLLHHHCHLCSQLRRHWPAWGAVCGIYYTDIWESEFQIWFFSTLILRIRQVSMSLVAILYKMKNCSTTCLFSSMPAGLFYSTNYLLLYYKIEFGSKLMDLTCQQGDS